MFKNCIFSVFVLVLFAFFQQSFCMAEQNASIDHREENNRFPIFESFEDKILWVGCRCPNKEEFKPKNYKKEAKQELIEEALVWLKEDKEDYCAELLVGYYCEKQEMAKALYWAHEGAKRGSGDCMQALRWFYAKGEGVIQDYEEAVKWAYLAAAKGSEEDKRLLNNLQQSDNLSDSLKKCKQRAKEWISQYPEAFFDPS